MSADFETDTTRTCDQSLGKSGSEAPTPQPVFVSNVDRPVLAIGDLHGHLDRFEALLRQEGLVDRCEDCDGTGITYRNDSGGDCLNCGGDGWARTDKEATIVLLGDVGHFGHSGSPTGDMLTWRAAITWADVILWGNHDRACIEAQHAFNGYEKPDPTVYHYMEQARWDGRLKLAYSAHGYLMTHAGLAKAFRTQNVPDFIKRDPREFAAWVNAQDQLWRDGHHEAVSKDFLAVRDAIGFYRGGASNAGGILWRDVEEKLYGGFRQVFGHSADRSHAVRYCWENGHTRNAEAIPENVYDDISYCVDIGGKGDRPGDNCLAGIWLPDRRIVRVDL